MAYYLVWERYTQLNAFVDQLGESIFNAALNREKTFMKATEQRIKHVEMGVEQLRNAVKALKDFKDGEAP